MAFGRWIWLWCNHCDASRLLNFEERTSPKGAQNPDEHFSLRLPMSREAEFEIASAENDGHIHEQVLVMIEAPLLANQRLPRANLVNQSHVNLS